MDIINARIFIEDYPISDVITNKIKNKYCKKNKIPLLRIPYTEFKNIIKQLKFDFELIEYFNDTNYTPTHREILIEE